MRDTVRNPITCDDVRDVMAQKRALTVAESAHVESCEACLEAWLEATVAHALETKPEVRIPADFAARVTAGLTVNRGRTAPLRGGLRHAGLSTAVLLIAAGLIAAAFSDPGGFSTRMGIVFMALVTSEIAGIALWLGIGHRGKYPS